MAKRDLLTPLSLCAADIEWLLSRSREYKLGRNNPVLAGRSVGLFFEKPSTRTRVSFEVAIHRLGGHPVMLPAESLQITRGETLADTARVLSGYLDGLIIRTFAQATLEEWAEHATIPVINALTDLHHPCQILADLFSIWEKRGRLRGLKLVYIGDGNNIAHSLLQSGAMMGMEIAVATPPGLAPDIEVVRQAQDVARTSGGAVSLHSDPMTAADGADVLYTDVWCSMGQQEDEGRKTALQSYQINAGLVARSRPDVWVMHCLPAHRGEEITADVMDGPHSIIAEQARNRLFVQQAILERWIGGSAA
jgi:ornithine carbamoyltransferase